MPRTPYHRDNWKRRFPAEAIWCESNPATSGGAVYAESGFLSAPTTHRLSRTLSQQAAEAPNAPALAWDVPTIPNGDYTVTVHDGGDYPVIYEYRIHLVTRGQLAGKRIVKYRNPDDGVFRGFGFLTKAGGFRLWSRFAGDSDLQYVLIAERMIQTTFLRNELDDMTGITVERTFSRDVLDITPRCIQCNRQHPLVFTPAAFCSEHATPPVPSAEGDYDVETDIHGNLRPIPRQRRTVSASAAITRAEARAAQGFSDPVEVDPPLLCENGTGEII